MSGHKQNHAGRRLVALLLAGTLSVPSAALAHEGKYVSELDIVSTETWLHNAIGGGIESGTSTAIENIVTNVGMGLLASALNSYIPGLGSILGIGNGGMDANTERILDAIYSSAVQLAERIDRLQDLVAAGQQVDIVSAYLTGEDLFEIHQNLNSVQKRMTNLEQLQAAMAHLLDAQHRIESLLFVTPERLMALEFLHTHAAIALMVGAVAAEQARLSVVQSAYIQAGSPAGTLDDFLLSRSDAENAALVTEIRNDIRAQHRTLFDSVFDFYEAVADAGLVREESDSWFSPATDPSKCWDGSKDASFDMPSYYQSESNWDENCCTRPAIYWGGTGSHCGRPADIFWYYFVKAPDYLCYRTGDDLYDNDGDEDRCNRFFLWDQTGNNSRYFASFDDYDVGYSTSGDGLTGYRAHRDGVYDAFVARIYGPVSGILDSMWKATGRSGTRPRNGLDNDLDFTITNVPGVPAASETIPRPGLMNFRQFPRYSMSMMQPMI